MSDRRPPKNFAYYVYLNDDRIKSFDRLRNFIRNAKHVPKMRREQRIKEIEKEHQDYINTKYPDNKKWLKR